MSDKSYEIHVQAPSGDHRITINESDRARRLTEILAEHGLVLNMPCGQEGRCDGCCIELLAGSVVDNFNGLPLEATGEPTEFHACQHRPGTKPATFRLPVRSLGWAEPDVLDAFQVDLPQTFDPIWPGSGVEAPAGIDRPLAAVIDVGTTTVTLMLVDLSDGEVLSRASDVNHQVRYGEDVLTRINLCMRGCEWVIHLRDALVRETIAPLLHKAAATAGSEPGQIVCITVAGNTTMLHLLAGRDPTPMGVVPFRPVFLEHMQLSASDARLGDVIQPRAQVHLLPSAAAYIGSDLIAGVVASGMMNEPGTAMLVDIGTNGEVVFKNHDQLLGCATAAGPAFEGAGLSFGRRAGKGVINHIHLSGRPLSVGVDTIQNAEPMGLCGSAYIDLLAEGLDAGLLTPTGRFATPVPDGLGTHIQTHARHGRCFEVTRGVMISERDIARLLQAKAAIAAGVRTVLARCQLEPGQIDRLYLAGGFGTGLNIHHALACGLLPGFRADQVRVVGNTALAGAYLAMINRRSLNEMSAIAQRIETVELNLDPGFEDRYIDHLLIG